MIHLVRHAHAGSRRTWTGDDTLRPLSRRGRQEAARIGRRLGAGDGPILSSPLLRCVQTVEPLAAALGVEIVRAEWLADGGSPANLRRRLADLGSDAVLCSHGDLIGGLIEDLAATGVGIDGPMSWPKGSIWHLDVHRGHIRTARYEAPAGIGVR